MTERDLGWLAGIFDGEGAIGMSRSQPPGQKTFVMEARVQMEMTCERTMKRVADLIEAEGIKVGIYFYRGRKAQHRPSWNLRISRLADVNRIAALLAPISVTKSEQWDLVLRFTTTRLEGVELDDEGRVKRGGAGGTQRRRPYSEEEVEIYERLRSVNARGS